MVGNPGVSGNPGNLNNNSFGKTGNPGNPGSSNPGNAGQVANLTTYNEVIITPLQSYNVTVPPGGFITIKWPSQ
jgi:hypothetical protein